MARTLTDGVWLLLEAATLVLPLPPPSLLRPGTPNSRCRAVLAMMQLATGLALPLAWTTVCGAQELAMTCCGAAAAGQQARSAGLSGGWQAYVYHTVQHLVDQVQAAPVGAAAKGVMAIGLLWHVVAGLTVPMEQPIPMLK